jgi:hypothetical protein
MGHDVLQSRNSVSANLERLIRPEHSSLSARNALLIWEASPGACRNRAKKGLWDGGRSVRLLTGADQAIA